jgi:MinD-like ATPase involved in chromosome partitioning or flagellar assembly
MNSQLEGFRRFVAQRAPVPTAAPSAGGQVVVLGSGKGGVGTSTAAALLALLASVEGRDVLLVDAVDGIGAQHLLFGVRPVLSLAALRGGEVEPRDLLLPVSPTLSLIAAGGDDPFGGVAITAIERRALLRRVATLYPQFDLVVVDGGSRLESVLAACSAGFDRILTVTTVDRIALAASYALLKAAAARIGEAAVDVLVNRHDEAGAAAAFTELRTAALTFGQNVPGYLGSLPDDACLAAGVAAGMPIHEAAAGSPAAAAMHALSQHLLRSVLARPLASG